MDMETGAAFIIENLCESAFAHHCRGTDNC